MLFPKKYYNLSSNSGSNQITNKVIIVWDQHKPLKTSMDLDSEKFLNMSVNKASGITFAWYSQQILHLSLLAGSPCKRKWKNLSAGSIKTWSLTIIYNTWKLLTGFGLNISAIYKQQTQISNELSRQEK